MRERRYMNSSAVPPHRRPKPSSRSSSSTISSTNSSSTTTSPSLSRSSDPPSTFLSTLTNLPPQSIQPLSSSLACTGYNSDPDVAPTTVFVTLTEGYLVTLTATDAAFTAPAILVTDATACEASFSPDFTPSSTECGRFCPQATEFNSNAVPADYTSTVYVTKKTPVPVVERTTSPPPVFQQTSKSSKSPPRKSGSPGSAQAKSAGKGSPSVLPEVASGLKPASQPQPVSAAATGAPAAVLSPKKSDRVPSNSGPAISVAPPKVIIGSQTVPIPTGSKVNTVYVSGHTYSVQSNQVVGPETTVPIGSFNIGHAITAAAAPSLVTETVDGVTFEIGATQAIISSQTYRIGPGANPTSTVLGGGQTVSFGQNGVGFPPSITIPPLSPASASVITASGLVITLDSSQAVISGTTYDIGSGSSPRTTVIGGQTISLGPSGLGIPGASTTVNPASVATGTDGSATVTVPLAVQTGIGATMAMRVTIGWCWTALFVFLLGLGFC